MSYYERTLPHWQPEGRDVFLTWRLSGSLPASVLKALKAAKTAQAGRRFREYDLQLDKGLFGPLWLKDPRIASLVAASIREAAIKELCVLHAWVVMPNHVHMLIRANVALARITKAIKGRTARQANLLLARTGKYFWQDESFDHWIRDEAEFEKVKKYVERNPVAARLVAQSADWPWSSAAQTKVYAT